ncbi:MAG: pyridoxamine 5'-phosphate oxidase family protein [Pseudomonadota bacterium]
MDSPAGLEDLPSPFHRGEQAIQERLGVREKIDGFARQAVRDFFPEQHRQFFAQLPFILIGAVDREGWPRASILTNRPGFIATPDARTVRIDASPPPGDPIADALRPGAAIGGLGIDFAARRRNRFTGHLTSARDGLTMALDQSFGNCPQYIQTRTLTAARESGEHEAAGPPERLDRLDAKAQQLIERSDAFFIATAAPEGDDLRRDGADVSHRGGKPGFVRVDGEGHLTFPDFAGNLHFNTLGNLILNPRVGLLFADFDTGDLLHIAGTAAIDFESNEIAHFRGAERLVRLTVDHMVRLETALPLRFEFGEFSPNSLMTGDWQEAAERLAAEHDRNAYKPYRVARIADESTTIRSFWLEPQEGGLAAFEAGQHLPIRVQLDGQDEPILRTYTISSSPAEKAYRLSIKREADGQISRHLHDDIEVGDVVEAMAPRGGFKADLSSKRPVVLIAGGVGVTPMRAMLEAFSSKNRRTLGTRPIHFIHAAKNAEERAFANEVREIAFEDPNVRVHLIASAPLEGELEGLDYHSKGRIDIDLIKSLLPFNDYDFYLCGPSGMMQTVYDGLRDLDISDARIHAEAFGQSSIKRRVIDANIKAKGTKIQFTKSGVETDWTPASGTLLDLAEKAGLSPAFTCRSGSCGTCATRLNGGRTRYLSPPAAEIEQDHVLICSAVPEGDDETLSLDL